MKKKHREETWTNQYNMFDIANPPWANVKINVHTFSVWGKVFALQWDHNRLVLGLLQKKSKQLSAYFDSDIQIT